LIKRNSTYRELLDEALILAIQRGEKAAFDELYLRYSKPLMVYFSQLLRRDEEKAADFVQDLFTKIITKPELIDASRSFKSWVYVVANNMCKNEYKRLSIRNEKDVLNEWDESNSLSNEQEWNGAKHTDQKIVKRAFDEAILKLEDKHREVVEMRHIIGMSIKEMAETLNTQEGTIKSRLFYATKQLAQLLEPYKTIAKEGI